MNIEQIRRLSYFSDTRINHLQLRERSLVIALLVGLALGSKAPISSSPVTNIDQHASDAIAHFNDVLSNMNEVYVIDVSTVVSVANAVYKHRYHLVHTPVAIIDGLFVGNYANIIGLPDNIVKILPQLTQAHYVEIETIVENLRLDND